MKQNLLNLNIPSDYTEMVNELIKLITVLLSLSVLLYISNISNTIINTNYLKLSILIILAYLTYYLIIKNIIVLNKD